MKTKRIQVKDLKPGAKIKSYDYQTNQIVFRTVEKVWSTVVQPHNQRLVEFNNGIGIKCSTKHPFMNDQAQQLLPDAINSSDLIVTDQTNPATMVSVSAINQDPMFIDLQVEDTHTFFASDSATGPMVLTHNSQGGIRNSSATINYPIWHYQFEDLIVLKNNKGTEETRVRHMDYAVAISALFYRRLKNNQSITLFDPNEVPDLYEAFYRDIDLFERLYCEYENRTDLTTKVLPAEVIIKEMLLAERGDTGRIYLVNIDNVQRQGPIDTKLHPIYQTNLCVEILLHTEPFQRLDDVGYLDIELNGQSIRIDNASVATLADGSKKQAYHILESDDVVSFELPDGQIITIE